MKNSKKTKLEKANYQQLIVEKYLREQAQLFAEECDLDFICIRLTSENIPEIYQQIVNER